MDHLRSLVCALLLIFLGHCFSVAHAVLPKSYEYQGVSHPWRSTPSAACADYGDGWVWQSSSGPRGGCTFFREWDQTVLHGNIYARLTCPANTTESGAGCLCDPGYVEDPLTSSCKALSVDDDLAEYCSRFSGNKRDASVYQPGRGDAGPNVSFTSTCRVPESFSPDGSSSGIPMFPGTDKGCGADFEYVWSGTDGGGNWTVFGYETYTGGTCVPGSSGGSTPGDPAGEESLPSKDSDKMCDGYQGTINGVSTCVPYASKTGTDGTIKKTNPDGSTEEQETETTCTGTKCETTITTTTRDANGNVTGVSTSVGTGTKDVYCNNNPKAAICKGDSDESSFGGSCATAFTCKGDVLQCVIAKEQHKRACELFDDENDETRLYVASKGKEGDQSALLDANRDLAMNGPGMFKTDAIFGSGSCVQDLNVQVMARTVQLPLSYLCPWVAELRYVLLGLGALYWVMIVFGRR